MAHERWENKIKPKYAKEYSAEELREMGVYTGKKGKELNDDDFEAEYLTFHSEQALKNDLKRQRKYNRTSYLKKLAKWAQTPEGQRYYRNKLNRDL